MLFATLIGIFFIPLFFGLDELYLWARPEEVAKHHLLQLKEPYLNVPFFLISSGIVHIDSGTAGILMATMPLVAASTKLFGQRIHTLFTEVQGRFADISTRVQESLAGVRVVRAYAQEEREEETFRKVNEDYLEGNRVAGLLVLDHDRIVLERYRLGNDERTRWMSMSVACPESPPPFTVTCTSNCPEVSVSSSGWRNTMREVSRPKYSSSERLLISICPDPGCNQTRATASLRRPVA